MPQLPVSDHLHLDFRPLAHYRTNMCTPLLLDHQEIMEKVATTYLLLYNLPSTFTYLAYNTELSKNGQLMFWSKFGD